VDLLVVVDEPPVREDGARVDESARSAAVFEHHASADDTAGKTPGGFPEHIPQAVPAAVQSPAALQGGVASVNKFRKDEEVNRGRLRTGGPAREEVGSRRESDFQGAHAGTPF
jgi:hypothetical protein